MTFRVGIKVDEASRRSGNIHKLNVSLAHTNRYRAFKISTSQKGSN